MTENKKETAKISANGHVYEFVILETLFALGVFHEWLSYAGKNASEISGALRSMVSDPDSEINAFELFKRLVSGDDVFGKLLELLINHLTIQKLFESCGTFLAGATIDGETCDELGMCTFFRKRPHEVYTALMFAVAANFPDYFPFVLEAVDTGGSPSQE